MSYQQLAETLGVAIPGSARRLLEQNRFLTRLHNAPGEQRAALLGWAKGVIDAFSYIETQTTKVIVDPEPATSSGSSGSSDPRWQLWKDLREAAGVSPGWEPFVMRRIMDVSTDNPALLSDRVEISFDCRMSKEGLKSSIEKCWPRLTAVEWVRKRRRMESRAADLIRHVCLENDPGTTWKALLAGWKVKYQKRHTQRNYKSEWAFQSDFHRAEQQLTGIEKGLDWFYSPKVRELASDEVLGMLPIDEIDDLTPSLRRYAFRKLRPAMHKLMRPLVAATRERATNGEVLPDRIQEALNVLDDLDLGEITYE